MKQGSDKSLVAPATVVNIGFENRWEAVFEGNGLFPVSPAGPFEITDPGISLKHVLVPGSLQDQTGPSVATEFGVLLPEVNGDQGYGASLAGIVSQRWDWGTLHFNAAASSTRDQNTDLFAGLILEGPAKWIVRPVAEIFYEEEVNQSHTISALVGLIWQVRDNLSFDVAYRHAMTDGQPVNEIRLRNHVRIYAGADGCGTKIGTGVRPRGKLFGFHSPVEAPLGCPCAPPPLERTEATQTGNTD